jgi:predicted amidohydrolase
MTQIRISLLHLALKAGDLQTNYELLEQGIHLAAAAASDWVVAPELCISGYQFIDVIGTDWIAGEPDKWTTKICHLAGSLKLMVLFGHVERTEAGKLYNSAFLVNREGAIVGYHRKINTHAESWASSAQSAKPINWNGLKIGILICADSYTSENASILHSQGAEMLISPAAWAPGLYGPEGEWEQRTIETGLPLIVCNRTGKEATMTFCDAQSLVIKNGKRLLIHSSERSALLTFEWDLDAMLPTAKRFLVTYI